MLIYSIVLKKNCVLMRHIRPPVIAFRQVWPSRKVLQIPRNIETTNKITDQRHLMINVVSLGAASVYLLHLLLMFFRKPPGSCPVQCAPVPIAAPGVFILVVLLRLLQPSAKRRSFAKMPSLFKIEWRSIGRHNSYNRLQATARTSSRAALCDA